MSATATVTTTGGAAIRVAAEQGLAGKSGQITAADVRRLTGPDPASLAVADRFVILAGTGQVALPADGGAVLQVTIKDAGSVAAHGAVPIAAADGATIDGAPSLTFTRPGQAATFTLIPGTGWLIT